MPKNPYADPTLGDPDLPPDAPRRVSGLAVSSLVFGLLCCIPGSGLIGVVLGGAGLLAIGKSDGRLSGRALAFVGLVLGVLGTAGWLAIGVGARQALVLADRQIFVPAVATLTALEQQDWPQAGKLLDPKSGIGPAELEAFAKALKDQAGTVIPGQHLEIGRFFSGQSNVSVSNRGNEFPVPLPLQYTGGTVLVFLIADSPDSLSDAFRPGGNLDGKVRNIAAVAGGRTLWLRDPALPPPAPAAGK